MLKIITKSDSETRKVGEMLAKELKSGEVLCLHGGLGSGKTTFVQGLAKGLKIKNWITSPTFTLIKEYKNLYHIDCYRLDNAKSLLDLGFANLIKSDNIIVIEWAEKIRSILPRDRINIKFNFINENTRRITI